MNMRHYIMFAEAIRDSGAKPAEKYRCANLIANVCLRDNPRFSREKFFGFIGIKDQARSA